MTPGRCPICRGELAGRPGGALVCPRCEPGDSLATRHRPLPGPAILEAGVPEPLRPEEPPPHWRVVARAAELPPGALERIAVACTRWRSEGDLDGINRDLLRGMPGGTSGLSCDPLEAVAELGGTVLKSGNRVAIRGHEVPEAIGRYRVVCRLGEGGMGEVYLAFRADLARDFAVKCLKPGRVKEERLLARFRREARALARMRHQNIVPLVDVELDGPVPHLAMEFIAGRSLADRILDGLPNLEAVRIVSKVCRAADHAHQAGILHRDIKPGNVLLDEHGEPFLTDFGLATMPDASGTLTRTGDVIGTPLYLPPEALAEREERGVASDVFGLGVVLYESLTGAHPFAGDTPMVSFRRILEGRSTPILDRDPTLPRPLAEICTRAIDSQPERRQPSAARLADELDGWLAGRPLRGRRPVLAWALAGIAVAIVAGAALMPGHPDPAAPPPPPPAEEPSFRRVAIQLAPPADVEWLRGEGSGASSAFLARGAGGPELWILDPAGRWTRRRPEGISAGDAFVHLPGEDRYLFLPEPAEHHAAGRARVFDPGAGRTHAAHLADAGTAGLLAAAFDADRSQVLTIRLQQGQLLAVRLAGKDLDWRGELDPEHLLVGSIESLAAAHDPVRRRTWLAWRRRDGELAIAAADWGDAEVAWLSWSFEPGPLDTGEVRLAARDGLLVALAGDATLRAAAPASGRIEFRPLPGVDGLRARTAHLVSSPEALLVVGSVEGGDSVEVWSMPWAAVREASGR